MNNFMNNGAVLPHGLLGSNNDTLAGFNKTYKNTSLRMGVIARAYGISDPKNLSKLATEYDVQVFEQNEDMGSTIITYKNCLGADALGSIADFFEKNFRIREDFDPSNNLINTTGQNGAVVLILCLDGVSEKGIIIGGTNHPDRETTLIDTQPRLTGEYNGVNVAINPDGSTALTWNSATNNDGEVIDNSSGVTTLSIGVDGTFTINNTVATIKVDNTAKEINMSTTGNWTVNIQGNTSITTQGDTNINTQGVANIIAQGTTTVDGSTIKLGVDAVEAVIKGNSFAAIYDAHVHIGNLGVPTSPPLEPMDPSLSTHTFTE